MAFWTSTPTPPCSSLTVVHEDVPGGRLELTLSTSERIAGAVTAAFGVSFAGSAVRFLRLPLPLPFKLIPLAFFTIGSTVAAAGVLSAAALHSVVVERGKGVTLRWRRVEREARELRIPTSEIGAFEVTSHVRRRHRSGTNDWDDAIEVEHHLVLVTRQGMAHAIERFGTAAQAQIRRRVIERILGGAEGTTREHSVMADGR